MITVTKISDDIIITGGTFSNPATKHDIFQAVAADWHTEPEEYHEFINNQYFSDFMCVCDDFVWTRD